MTPPLRILQVLDKLSMDGKNPSSPAMVVADWVRHADPARVTITVLSLRPPEPAGLYLASMGLRVAHLSLGPYDMRNVGALARAARQAQADVIHVHGFAGANFGRVAARLTGALCVVQEHAVCRVPAHQSAADAALRRLTGHAVAVAGNVKEFMIRRRHVPADRVEILYNGVETEPFREAATSRGRKRRELGLDGATVVGSVTRLRSEKGVDHFLSAAALVKDRFPDAVFLVVGSGPERTALEKQAAALGLDGRVRFLGFRHDVPELLAAMDVHVIPSLTEGCPLSLLEAMAAGKPIVASRVGGMQEIGEATGAAALVPPNDAQALADEIDRLLTDRDAALRLGETAARAAEGFSARRAAERLTDFYERICDGRPRRVDPVEKNR
jgi:glycosyltransferase involved in cell wall biosynthesis